MRKIGMITIGQSPRDDILAVMTRYFTSEFEILQRGALDGLDRASINRMRPEEGQLTLVSRLRDGTEVELTHANVLPLLREGIDNLIADGAEFIVSLCTGEFTDLRSDSVFILHPGTLLRGVVMALAQGAKLGVVRPSASQVTEEEVTREKRWWGALDVFVTWASPYAQPEIRARDWQRAAEALKKNRVDLTFLNCMGMDEEMKWVVNDITRKPVVLASAVVARTVDELIGPGVRADWSAHAGVDKALKL